MAEVARSCPQGASQSCACAAMETKQEPRLQTRSNGWRRQVAHRAPLSHIPLQPWRKGDGRASRGVQVAVASVGCLPPCHLSVLHLKVATRHQLESCPQDASRSGRRAGASPSNPLPHFQSLHVLSSPVTRAPSMFLAISKPSQLLSPLVYFFCSYHQSSTNAYSSSIRFPPVPLLSYIITHPFSNTVPSASTSCRQCRRKSSLVVSREADGS